MTFSDCTTIFHRKCEAVSLAEWEFIYRMADLIDSLPVGTLVYWNVDLGGVVRQEDGRVTEQDTRYAKRENDGFKGPSPYRMPSRRMVMVQNTRSQECHWLTF